jgi:carbon monoxide dehydrogenase subunit G
VSAIEVAQRIEAPITKVWAELERIEDHSAWMADAVAIRFDGAQRRGVGTRIDVDTRVGPLRTVDRMEFVRWEPPVAMGVRHQGLVAGTGEFLLTQAGGVTTVTWREDLAFPWYFGASVGAWLARPVLRHIWRNNLERLAARC